MSERTLSEWKEHAYRVEGVLVKRDAEITALRAALDQEKSKAAQAAHLLTQSRIWGGMGWVWNPLRGTVVEQAHALLSGRGEDA